MKNLLKSDHIYPKCIGLYFSLKHGIVHMYDVDLENWIYPVVLRNKSDNQAKPSTRKISKVLKSCIWGEFTPVSLWRPLTSGLQLPSLEAKYV